MKIRPVLAGAGDHTADAPDGRGGVFAYEGVILSLIQNSFIHNTVLCCLVCLYSSLGVPDRGV
ncbi:uncharacterized protein LOC6042145 isoform X2 [Culex quinquefasciatus]|uniref:uncharacterized protein LOC6042145 isoform X2 n=1 Tax=Culex quinquefasciatus TaxID=7176 RepID=UPI0018E3533D|nr:uncharacterized protein LOC6042145 isoform X2 [Culex quinquefasciatus]